MKEIYKEISVVLSLDLKRFTLLFLVAACTTTMLVGCEGNSSRSQKSGDTPQVVASNGQQVPQTELTQVKQNNESPPPPPRPAATRRPHYYRVGLVTQVRRQLENQMGITISNISCPAIENTTKPEVGKTFTCQITTEQDETRDVTVTFTNQKGDIRWKFSES